MTQTPICISGVARAGKDLFAAILIEQLNLLGHPAKRFALADSLKRKVRPFLLELSGIDILSCSPPDKELARDLLVAVGKIKRYQSQGQYWTGLLEQEIIESKIRFPVITDIRYDVFPEDEIYWAQKRLNGILVHVTRYGEDGQPIAAPNMDEKTNDPRLREKADYRVEWPTYINDDAGHDKATGHVIKFIEHILPA